MKKGKIFLSTIVLTLVLSLLVTGCGNKREELRFDGGEGSFTILAKRNAGYKISSDADDLRTSKEQAVIIGKDFSIGIEFNDDLDYFFNGDFNELKKTRIEENNAQEVTYSNIKGIQYFYDGYMRYTVILPINGNKKYTLNFNIYGKEETEESAKEAIKNEDVLDILNNLQDIKVK